MKLKKLNIIILLAVIIISGTALFAQDQWIVKITGDLPEQETLVYEGDVIRFIENMRLFTSLFPNPMTMRRPMTPEVFDFKEQTQKDFKDEKMRKNFIEKYVDALLFVIKADELDYYNEKKLDIKSNEFHKLMEIQIMSKVYIIKELIPSTEADDETIDKFFNMLKNQMEASGMMLPLDEIDKLATQYAVEQTATEDLLKTVNEVTSKKRIKIDDENPFIVKIDGIEEFSPEEAETVFKGYLNLLHYVYQGGLAEEEDMEKLYNDYETKKKFIKEYINYHIVKKIVTEKGLYDDKYIIELADRCTEYFRMNYINIRYAREKILPKVEKSMNEDKINDAVQIALTDPEYSKFINEQTKDMSEEQKSQWVENWVKTRLYQQLIVQLKTEEIQELKYEYSIEYNYD
jgi:hypothetical protein